jgi:ADP-ribose pyrophosphatase YjhB (NUDIX family)
MTKRKEKVKPTVDIAVIRFRNGRVSVLMGQKSASLDLWRFPGGFVDDEDIDLESAAIRELKEETDLLTEQSRLTYVGSHKITDDRFRGEFGIMTTLFVTAQPTGFPVAGDDLFQIRWFELNHHLEEITVPAHKPLIRMLLDRLAEGRWLKA